MPYRCMLATVWMTMTTTAPVAVAAAVVAAAGGGEAAGAAAPAAETGNPQDSQTREEGADQEDADLVVLRPRFPAYFGGDEEGDLITYSVPVKWKQDDVHVKHDRRRHRPGTNGPKTNVVRLPAPEKPSEKLSLREGAPRAVA